MSELTKGERTRSSIVAAAAPIFNQRGYEGSSLSDLMEATGLKKGGIYRHFASKEELAAAAFDFTWEGAWKARMVHVDEKANGLEKVKQLINNFIERRSPVAGGCPILNTAVEADDGNPVLRERAAKALGFWMERLQSFVEQAKKEGHARKSIDAKTVAMVIISSLEGALMISRLQGDRDALHRVRQHLHSYLDSVVSRLAKPGVAMSGDAARKSACATNLD